MMKTHRLLYLFSLLPLLLNSCTGTGNKYVISGKINGQEGKTLYLQKFENNLPVTIDSTVIEEDGSFKLKSELPRTDFYQLMIQPGNAFVFIGDKQGELSIESDITINNPKKITGSEDTKLLVEFGDQFNRLMLKKDSIAKLKYNGALPSDIKTAMRNFSTEAKDYIHRFIDAHPGSPASLAALSKLNPVEDLAYFKKVKDGIAGRMDGSPYYTFLETQIMQAEQEAQAFEIQRKQQEQAEKMLPVGGEAPDISMEDPSGKVRTLKELRGKVVLIDFWASWCKPCRIENPNVVRAYSQFKNKGFEILSVSLDKNKDAWINAIKEDGLTWTHVSDLQFWNSAAARTYGVTSIPFAVLVDREGKIIAKNLRGEELTRKLKEILG